MCEAEERNGGALPETGAVARPDGAYRTPQPDRPNGGSRAHDPRDSDRSERKPPQVQDHRGRRRLSCARYDTRRIRNPDLPAHIRSAPGLARSEEHTSELQSLMRISYAVFCLKKKQTHTNKLT